MTEKDFVSLPATTLKKDFCTYVEVNKNEQIVFTSPDVFDERYGERMAKAQRKKIAEHGSGPFSLKEIRLYKGNEIRLYFINKKGNETELSWLFFSPYDE